MTDLPYATGRMLAEVGSDTLTFYPFPSYMPKHWHRVRARREVYRPANLAVAPDYDFSRPPNRRDYSACWDDLIDAGLAAHLPAFHSFDKHLVTLALVVNTSLADGLSDDLA